jgi:SNF2 family DNA or RNA helicase
MAGQKDQPILGKKIYIISYDLAARSVNQLKTLINFNIVICDEAHYLKNRTAKRSK